MKERIKVGYIGLGRRGMRMLTAYLSKMPDVDILAVCDLCEDKMEAAKKSLMEDGRPAPKTTANYLEIINDPEIEAVLIMTGWNDRPKMAKEAMLAHKYTAIEVGCAETLEECFELLEVYEKTGTPLMMLENCCYGRLELMLLNMVKQGLFGEIVHCTGAYAHYLNPVEFFYKIGKDDEVTHYRLAHYINGNRENYPTHELGPICKMLGINRGNRMLSLSSFASKSAGIKQYAKDTYGEDNRYAKIDYKQGDIVNTVITCANGETILLTLDTTLPRTHYSRNISVRGTKGMASEESRAILLDGMKEPVRDNLDEFYAKYEHPLQAEIQATVDKSGVENKVFFGAHANGIDWSVLRAFVESVKAGTETPIDIYDTLTLLSIGALSEKSIQNGGAPVEVPDFTRGKWQNREPAVRSKYCLDEIVVDPNTKVFPQVQ
ncbi:MAG: Gfo/Idh/MocA family oxidoreductase [Clostridia bacterium]|nr:Gfo/Idh/MocA family oxidoreductase [Clostridia bacterium]